MRMSDDAEQSGAGGEVRVRRRRWSEARKRQIVTESYQPGVSVSVVARRHDVNANMVFSWRRQYRELARMAGGFVPVVVTSTEGAEPAKLLPAPPDIALSASGRMEIALADGSRVTVDRDVDAAALSRVLGQDPHAGDLFIFRGRKGDLVKILWTDGIGTSLYAKRLERGRFPWPAASGEAVSISAAQLGYLLEGIDWRNPVRTWRPSRAG